MLTLDEIEEIPWQIYCQMGKAVVVFFVGVWLVFFFYGVGGGRAVLRKV